MIMNHVSKSSIIAVLNPAKIYNTIIRKNWFMTRQMHSSRIIIIMSGLSQRISSRQIG